jgi:tetratricopeptide (TPR) repeat protein
LSAGADIGIDLGGSKCRMAAADSACELLPVETWPDMDPPATAPAVRLKRRLLAPARPGLTGAGSGVVETLASVLGEARKRAARHLGTGVDGAILSIPPALPDRSRDIVLLAASTAGFARASLWVDAAAALLHHVEGARWSGRAAVLAMGETTFAVSVYDASPDGLSARTHATRPRVSGIDMDELVLLYLSRNEGLRLDAWGRGAGALLAQAAILREKLSEIDKAVGTFGDGAGLQQVRLARGDMERLMVQIVEHVRSALAEALSDAGPVDHLFLLGGATRTPWVRRLVEEKVGDSWTRLDEGAVARGAALAARRSPPAPLLPQEEFVLPTEAVRLPAPEPQVPRPAPPDLPGSRLPGPAPMTAAESLAASAPRATALGFGAYVRILGDLAGSLPEAEAIDALEDLRAEVKRWLASAHVRIGDALCVRGRTEEGLRHYHKARELDRENTRARDSLADLYYRRAERLARSAAHTGRRDLKARAVRDAARKDLRQCLDLQPDHVNARKLMEWLSAGDRRRSRFPR